MSAAKALAAMFADHDDTTDNDPMPEVNAAGRAAALADALARYQKANTFKPGDLVVWKPGLRNKQAPVYGEPAIIVEVFETPLRDASEDPSSSYFREQLHGRVGIIMDDRPGLAIFHFDFNRFEPYRPA